MTPRQARPLNWIGEQLNDVRIAEGLSRNFSRGGLQGSQPFFKFQEGGSTLIFGRFNCQNERIFGPGGGHGLHLRMAAYAYAHCKTERHSVRSMPFWRTRRQHKRCFDVVWLFQIWFVFAELQIHSRITKHTCGSLIFKGTHSGFKTLLSFVMLNYFMTNELEEHGLEIAIDSSFEE